MIRKAQPPAPPPVLAPVVPANDRSPFSRETQTLLDALTPIEPKGLFEAGNLLSDAAGLCGWDPAVSLLASGSDVVGEPPVPLWATSAAAGVIGNFVERLHASSLHPSRLKFNGGAAPRQQRTSPGRLEADIQSRRATRLQSTHF